MKLTEKKCIPCQGGEPVLKDSEIAGFLKEVNKDWRVEEKPKKIVRDLVFTNFKEAIKFINSVAKLAEEEGHHPNIYLHSYRKLRIELWTHKINGLHQNDFILAAKIDQLL